MNEPVLYIKKSDQYKSVTEAYIKRSDGYKKAKLVYVKDGGAWKHKHRFDYNNKIIDSHGTCTTKGTAHYECYCGAGSTDSFVTDFDYSNHAGPFTEIYKGYNTSEPPECVGFVVDYKLHCNGCNKEATTEYGESYTDSSGNKYPGSKLFDGAHTEGEWKFKEGSITVENDPGKDVCYCAKCGGMMEKYRTHNHDNFKNPKYDFVINCAEDSSSSYFLASCDACKDNNVPHMGRVTFDKQAKHAFIFTNPTLDYEVHNDLSCTIDEDVRWLCDAQLYSFHEAPNLEVSVSNLTYNNMPTGYEISDIFKGWELNRSEYVAIPENKSLVVDAECDNEIFVSHDVGSAFAKCSWKETEYKHSHNTANSEKHYLGTYNRIKDDTVTLEQYDILYCEECKNFVYTEHECGSWDTTICLLDNHETWVCCKGCMQPLYQVDQ